MATSRSRPWWKIGGIVFATICVTVCGLFFRYSVLPHWEHQQWYQMMEERILKLAEKVPDDVSPSQWAFCLCSTWNLHANCGGYEYFDLAYRERFLAQLDCKLNGRVDLSTIDWIWDQYVNHSRGGSRYSLLYRPSTPEHLRELSGGKWGQRGQSDLDEFVKQLSQRRAGQKK
jgi:hypothetical protein